MSLVLLSSDSCRGVLEGREGKEAQVKLNDDMMPLEEQVDLDTEDSVKEPTGPPFGIVVNGHSLVR